MKERIWRYKKDSEIEKTISRFMDENLYSNEMFKDVKRTKDKSHQVSGCDIIFSIPSLNLNNIVVDEKCSSHYCDGKLKTFTLELSLIDKANNIIDGWFLNEKNKTEYYMLMWLTTPYSKKEWYKVNYDSIQKIDFALVSKNRIFEYLKENGLTKDELRKGCEKIRSIDDKIATDIKGIDYTYSKQFAEKPINIKMCKDIYKKIAILEGNVVKQEK